MFYSRYTALSNDSLATNSTAGMSSDSDAELDSQMSTMSLATSTTSIESLDTVAGCSSSMSTYTDNQGYGQQHSHTPHQENRDQFQSDSMSAYGKRYQPGMILGLFIFPGYNCFD